jgi:hypothetical protein
LLHYRHAMLDVTWLDGRVDSAFHRLLSTEGQTRSAAQDRQPAFDLQNEGGRGANRVVRRVLQAISEIGYDYFSSDVTSNEFISGDDTPLGSKNAAVIPSDHRLQLAQNLVGVTKGSGRGRLGFARVMEEILSFLREPGVAIRFLLVLCDAWDASESRLRYLEELRRFPDLQTLFILAWPGFNPPSLIARTNGQHIQFESMPHLTL